MSTGDRSTSGEQVDAVTPEALRERIAGGEAVFLLDVRTEAEYAEWRIEGERVESLNYPYVELLDGLPADLLDALPDQRVTVLCAKGGASEFVAERLAAAGSDVEHLERGMKGWARVYEYAELDADADATVAQYRRPSSGCLSYLVVSGDEAAVVDPLRAFADEYAQDARALGARLTYAIDTHVHADHVSGVRTVAAETGATAVVPAPAVDRGVEYDAEHETVADGEVLSVGDAALEAIHAPGHTTGMTAYRVSDVLFTGDALFTEAVARPDLEDSEAARDAARTLHESLTERVLSFPDETLVAPGHVDTGATPWPDGTHVATLGAVRDRLALLSMDCEEFVEAVAADVPPRPANYETIVETNLGHESVDDETAFELELGPNNCAAGGAEER